MGRKRKSKWLGRGLGALLLVGLVAGGWLWWGWIHWTPPEDDYPVQGVEIGAQDGEPDFASLAAVGARFVYLDASEGASSRDESFARNFAAATASALEVGTVHRFDPCAPAEEQSANFVTIVPREGASLPPAIELDATGDDCEDPVGEAAIESELMTFLNQIESHVGQPAVLKLHEGFETRYGLGARIERNLWLVRDRFRPEYAGRPFALWTANSALRSEASEHPLRWVVAQP